MKIVSRYVIVEFIKIFLLISIGLTTLYIIVDVFENLSDFTRTHTDFITVLRYFLLHLPQAVYYIIPLSLLFASFLNLGLFTKYNEIIAMRSGGLSLLNIISPLLLITSVISIFSFFLNDSIISITNSKAQDIKRKVEAKPREMFFKEDSLWLKSGDYIIYNVRFIDTDKKIMGRINVYYLTPDFQIRESISADKAKSENGQWFLESGIRRVIKGGMGELKIYTFDRLPISFPFKLQDFRHVIVQASETRFTTLKNYIDRIKREGYEVKRLTVDLYAKTSFPVAGFVMAIFGFSLALHMKRYGGLAGGAGLCIIVSILYWVTYSLSLHMGYAGYLPALLSAWLANIVFMAAGGYIFYTATKL